MLSVVVLRALGLGDLLTGLPALRALRDAYPRADITLAAPSVLAPIAALSGAVDGVADTAPLRPLHPALHGADLAVDLHGRGPESTRLLLATGPRRLISFEHRLVPETRGHPRWIPEEHEVTRWCRLLTESGIAADPRRLGLRRPAAPSPAPGGNARRAGAATAMGPSGTPLARGPVGGAARRPAWRRARTWPARTHRRSGRRRCAPRSRRLSGAPPGMTANGPAVCGGRERVSRASMMRSAAGRSPIAPAATLLRRPHPVQVLVQAPQLSRRPRPFATASGAAARGGVAIAPHRRRGGRHDDEHDQADQAEMHSKTSADALRNYIQPLPSPRRIHIASRTRRRERG
jgi:hypothetical protein